MANASPARRALLFLTCLAPSAVAGIDDEALELHAWKERLAHARLVARLRTQVLALELEDVALDRALVELSRALGRPILPSAGLLDAVARGAVRPVTWRLPRARATTVLAGLRTLTGTWFVYRAGQIHAMRREEFRPEVTKRFYAVHDITFRLRDFPPPRPFDLRASRDEAVVEELPEPRPAFGFDEDALLDLVRRTTGGRSWDEDDRVHAEALRGLFVVRQTPRAHVEIERLLRAFR